MGQFREGGRVTERGRGGRQDSARTQHMYRRQEGASGDLWYRARVAVGQSGVLTYAPSLDLLSTLSTWKFLRCKRTELPASKV